MKSSNRGRAKELLRTLAAATAVAAFALPHSTSLAAPSERPALSDLQKVDQLRVAFSRDAGKTRLVLLLSPT